MKCKALTKYFLSLMAPLSMAVAGSVHAAPQKIHDFGLIDHKGDQYQVSRLGYHSAVVIIAQSNNCQANIDELHRYKLLRTTWEPKGVKFLMLNADAKDDLQSIRSLASVYDINFPIMYDESQLVAESLKLSKAGEVLIVDPKNLQLVFRGPLDTLPERAKPETATKDLVTALDRVVNGKHNGVDTVNLPVTNECDLPIAAKGKPTPDYAKDVAPILKKNCAHCHVQGGIGPFAMNSYEMVRGWAPMIRETIMTKRMPPAQVDPHVSHFDNANYLAIEDSQTLVHWIDAGAPRGNAKADPLHAVTPVKTDVWQLDTPPDVVIDVPAFTVPPTGVLDYFNHEIDLGFDEDKYVKAVQFIPGDKRVLHHLLAYVSSPNFDRKEIISEENIRDFLEGYAPGKIDVTVFPENTGVFIQKGNKLVMQMHYTTFGKEVVDATRVGLWFHDKKPEFKYLTESVSHRGAVIAVPPNKAEHAMNAQHVFEHDTMLYALRPHMHYRGKAFKFTAIFPDGRREVLLNVPNYNFAWQPTYRLSEPKFLPAGTRVVNDGVFDNSEFNPGNPDPTVIAKGGLQSWDEMFIGYYTFTNLEENKQKYSSK